jgi:uncharacterized SAM-binding protein YcdF (DUF218 family)
MIKNGNVICISSIDWDFVWQGHQEIMSILAANGNKVLFIENTGVRTPNLRDIGRLKKRLKNWYSGIFGIRKERNNLYIYSPLVLPFPHLGLARWLNKYIALFSIKQWMRIMDFSDPVIWTFLPTGFTLDLADKIPHKALIYYCIDNFLASSPQASGVRDTEIELFKRADLVFVTAMELYAYSKKYRDEVSIFPFGVNVDKFERYRQKKERAVPEDMSGLPRPIIGYQGGIHKWVDLDLVGEMARIFPEWSFVMVGPAQVDISGLSNIGNVHFLGKKSHDELVGYIDNFDVCTIPYLITDYTRNVYPTKLNEYLALGKTVVSTALPEVLSFNEKYHGLVRVADDHAGFAAHLMEAVSRPEAGPAALAERYRAAGDNSWHKRVEEMSVLIEKAMEKKKTDIDTRWNNSLKKIYRSASRKTLILAAAAFFSYFAIFKTPLIWFLAEPLRVSDEPRKADVIVVFGGGVGETGEAGQGYEERVLKAVDLYRKGYAGKIIFSTGYVYAINEADIMGALAVSFGVPPEDIILEKKAATTYQNVIFTSRIIEEKTWRTALIVTAPYHMRRVRMVYATNFPDINAVSTPVEPCSFFGNKKEIRLRQIRALIHEIAAIADYKYKGYI